MNNLSKSVIIIGIIILALIHKCTNVKKNNVIESLTIQNQILLDTVVQFKDANKKQAAKIKVIELSNINQLKNIESQKHLVTLLQSEVKLYKQKLQSAIGIVTITEFDTLFKTDSFHITTNSTDTFSIKSFDFQHSDNWIKINIQGDGQNTSFSVGVKNEYTVSIVKVKKGFDAIVKNSNPYSTTKEIIATKVSLPKPKKFGVGVVIGYGLTFPMKPSPFVGIGLSYNILRF